MASNITTQNYITRVKIIHSDKYDYDLVIYTNARNFIDILCPTHGIFSQRANSHLSGNGCKKCAVDKSSNVKRLTLDEFRIKSDKVHNNKYDYSLVEYSNNRTKVNIVCNIHGSFFQSPTSHLSGNGCPICATQSRMLSNSVFYDSMRYSQSDLVDVLNQIHQRSYDYSLVEYVNISTPITVICPLHGEFYPTPYAHLKGSTCSKCRDQEQMLCNNATFIDDSRRVHGDKYRYNDIEYVNHHTNVNITCNIHGNFKQLPMVHIRGSGCLQCSAIGVYSLGLIRNSPYLSDLPCTIYLIKLVKDDEVFYKVGITRTSVHHRLLSIIHYVGEVVCSTTTTLGLGIILEQFLLAGTTRYIPQYKFGGHTECVEFNPTNLKYLTKHIYGDSN